MWVSSWEAKCQQSLKDTEGFRVRRAAVEGPVVIGVHTADPRDNQQDEDRSRKGNQEEMNDV